MSTGHWSLAIHGGAGVNLEEVLTKDRSAAIRAELSSVLDAVGQRLSSRGTSLDAVEDAVRRLEDSPLFNAGRGAVFNARGEHELEASIMDGRTLDAGAVALLSGIRNPIVLARRVMERSPHLFLCGEGALEFAAAERVETADPGWFRTDERCAALERARTAASPDGGTVGAVALDVHGNLAAGTSTGGLTNKAPGRVGDSPIIGAGTFASNVSCAVSCTGQGEYFVRATAARDIAALVEYAGNDVRTAADAVIAQRLSPLGGEGGVIVVDRAGEIAMSFNTQIMHRGSLSASAPMRVAIHAHDEA